MLFANGRMVGLHVKVAYLHIKQSASYKWIVWTSCLNPWAMRRRLLAGAVGVINLTKGPLIIVT